MPSSFADRLWWARHKAGLGATKLARAVKCSQSLISGLERNNAERSAKNNEFAKVLQVDANWLAFGTPGKAPPDFNEDDARRGREGMGRNSATTVRLPPAESPRWAAPEATPVGEPLAPLTGADAMWTKLTNLIMEFARTAGVERALALRELIPHIVAIVSFEKGEGQQQVVGSDERNHRSNH